MNWPIFFRLNDESFTFHLQYKHSGTFANSKYEELSYPQKSENVQPHSSYSIENAAPLKSIQSWKCDLIQRHIPGFSASSLSIAVYLNGFSKKRIVTFMDRRVAYIFLCNVES